MRTKLMRSAMVLGALTGALLMSGCGGDKLSDARIRAIRQSPFLFVPPSASQLLAVDMTRLRQFSIYEDFRKIYMRDVGRASVWNEVSRRFNDDPLAKIDQVLFAGYAPKFARPMQETVVVVTGTWGDDELFLEALQMFAGAGLLENPPPFARYTQSPVANAYQCTAMSSLHPGEEVTLYVSFPGEGICVFTLSQDRFVKANGAIFETLPAITDDKGWDEHFSRVRLDQPIWAAGWTPIFEWREFIEEKINTVPELENLWALVHNHPVKFYGYISPTPQYLADFELICESPEDAEAFVFDLNKARRVIPRMLNSWFGDNQIKIDEWQSFLNDVDIRRDGASIFLKAEVPDEETRSLVNITAAEAVATPTPKPVPDPFKRRSEE